MFFGSNKIIGLDIGTSTIKLVEVEGSGKKTTLTSFGYIPTPPGSVISGEIVQPEILSQAVSELVRQTKTKRKKTAVGIYGTAMITKKISIPRIEESLLPEQLRWEAEQYIPFDISEINLSYQVLHNTSANSEQMNILLVAAKKDLVLRCAEVVETAGLSCEIVDVAGFALSNTFSFNYAATGPHTAGLLCIGAGSTHFVIVENNEVTFCRDIPIGGMTYTSDLQKTMGISIQEAESLKISAGQGQPVPQEVTESLNHTNDVVCDEIRRSYDFYLATAGDVTIPKFFITGGASVLPSLKEKLNGALNLPVEKLNPFQSMNYDSGTFTADFIHQISPYIGVGLGLAMRGR